jgi:hypothetical protein
MSGLARRAFAVLFAASASATAWAQSCAGFNDVISTHPQCNNVEWIRNRAITLGCTSTSAFCPTDFVTRLQMAAFMNRLGTALTPQQLVAEGALTAPQLDLDTAPVACSTTPQFAVAGYPRRALVDLSLSAQAGTSLDVTAIPVVSFNNGTTWIPLAASAGRGSVTAGQWGHVSGVAVRDLHVGESVRFGMQLSRASGSGDLSGGACQLRVQIVSRDGASSPF